MSLDVIVLGGGIIGASAAYELAKRGRKVALIDQFEPGHVRGSSHGDGRVVRFNYTESIYVEMAKLAYPAWEALGESAGQPMFQKTGLVEYGPVGHEAILESEANLQRHGIPYERLTPAEASERFPQFRFVNEAVILYQADGAVAFADRAVKASWELAQAEGAEAITNERIVGVQPNEGSVTVVGESGKSWTAASLVITAGAWAGKLLAGIGIEVPLVVTQEFLSYFPPKDDVSHRVGDLPVAIDYHTESPFYAVPQVEVPGLKVGWHHTGSETDPDNANTDTQKLLEGAQGWIDRFYPHLEREPIETQTCLYTNTPDYHFIIDHHPEHANIIIGAGFSGHGFKFGPMLGQILGNLAVGEASPVPLGAFSLARFDDAKQLQKRVGA